MNRMAKAKLKGTLFLTLLFLQILIPLGLLSWFAYRTVTQE